MCESCGKEGADAYSNWLLHHRPNDLDEQRKEVSILEQSIDVLLTLRFDTLTMEEVTSNYKVTEDKAREICRTSNSIMSSIEDFLIGLVSEED